MSVTRPEAIDAFRLLYLAPAPTAESVNTAVVELRELSVEQFTDIAVAAIADSELESHDVTVCATRRRLWKNVGSTPNKAWHFDVYVDSGNARKRVDMWLCTDGTWAVSTGVQRPTMRRMTELEQAELTDVTRLGLIEGRARRVMTWLDKPHGTLNPGIA